MAMFKVRLDDDRSITVPQPEVDALEMEAGDLLQVVAYPWNSSDE
jgi:bifunctional DNA-binding transcriptional regulator/antitoxin component of YhaV-PrlF toxin-antitoxin module